ncbi:hypothetical protein [Tritonibacter scottomollicae]|uniref:Uncharacterized protein n=1 Tax=Tritonibacter scottomollicae TaxID=483013 RepID=A0A2T1AID9_TRISK|nr:hypothetical protein [Tritonibacter scottomollicae]PRZ48343.1 hypothetical protein CLV89_104171 [Tritonibacter scottomollicae]
MTALTTDRNTPRHDGELRHGLVAAASLIYAGSIVLRAADGYLHEGHTATGLVGVGRAEARVDNRLGADGDEDLTYRPGIFRFANSAGADGITFADVGELAFVVDDQTVAKTDGTTTRSPAGIIDGVDANGVWVRFDEALTKAS